MFQSHQRGDGQYVALERAPGVAIMAPAWVLDAAVCSTLSLGVPLVSIAALNDLHSVLASLGFRRGCVDEESTKEAEYDPGTKDRSSAAAATLSSQSNYADETGGEGNCSDRAGPASAFGSGESTGGDER